MIVVKKVDAEAKIVTVLSEGILEQIDFHKFLTVPKVSDVVSIQPSFDGEAKYVIVEPSDISSSITSGKSTKNKFIAGILGLFLGSLGVHNFYLGNNTKAVWQLLGGTVGWITFGFIPVLIALWAFIESILILTSSKGSKWHQDAAGLELLD